MSRVVIIDDEALMRDLFKEMMERLGHKTEVFNNGATALEYVLNNPCDLVITDIVMPEIDGIEFLRALQEKKTEFKIIAISGGGRIRSDNYLQIAEILGADYTFEKPLDWHLFKVKIAELLPDTIKQ